MSSSRCREAYILIVNLELLSTSTRRVVSDGVVAEARRCLSGAGPCTDHSLYEQRHSLEGKKRLASHSQAVGGGGICISPVPQIPDLGMTSRPPGEKKLTTLFD